jgi:uncharacterized membrane protein YedE/YeeE
MNKNNLPILISSFLAGALFAAGLALSGMTQPSKVIAFLDVTGNWDPSLAMVMVGAIGVYMSLFKKVTGAESPVCAASFSVPTNRQIDLPLVGGAALFGAGWGIAGYCPGPALASIGTLGSSTLVFVGMMTAGMVLTMSAQSMLAGPAK